MTSLLKLTIQYLLKLLVMLTLLPIHAYAHPHNWITLKTEFTLDERGQLTALLQHWKFDIYYSEIRLADIKNEYRDQQQGLDQVAKEMAKNLKNYNYFSELKINDQLIALTEPSTRSLSTVFEKDQQQLILTMGFKLEEPWSIGNKTLSWRVFDPTYYIDMRHQKLSQILIHKSKDTECSTHIESPKLSEEMIKYAASLDRTQKNTQGLGDYFAEKVLIRCN